MQPMAASLSFFRYGGGMPPTSILKYFSTEHLPTALANVSRPFQELAYHMHDTLPDGPEKSAGLRKLLEAKDCAVRAALG